jgi:hypothetical protein
MNRLLIIYCGLILVTFGCVKESIPLNTTKVLFNEIDYNSENLILLECNGDWMKSPNYVKDTIVWRGIDSYTCWSRDSILEIDMSYGFMSYGQHLNILINKDTAKAKMINWSDGARGESFGYDIVDFSLTLSNSEYLNQDSVTGKIYIKGFENLNDNKNYYIENLNLSDWEQFQNKHTKTEVTISGEFKLAKVKYASDGGNKELNRTKIQLDKRYKRHLGKLTNNELDSLNASSLKWKVFPEKILALDHLRILNLQGNKLNNIDFSCLNHMEKLESIDLRWNGFRSFPKNILTNGQLRILNLFGNPIEEIPIDDLLNSKIEYLNLKGSKIDTVRLNELRMKMKIEL